MEQKGTRLKGLKGLEGLEGRKGLKGVSQERQPSQRGGPLASACVRLCALASVGVPGSPEVGKAHARRAGAAGLQGGGTYKAREEAGLGFNGTSV
jgi:hypothetical protein